MANYRYEMDPRPPELEGGWKLRHICAKGRVGLA